MNKLKIFLSVISVLFFSLNASAENVYNWGELDYSGGILVTREDIPVTGIVKGYYNSGNLKSETEYKDGKINGVEKIYFENGKLEYETEYKDGKENGVEKRYDENGNLKYERYYANGEEADLIKKIKNPNMQYAKNSDLVGKYIKAVTDNGYVEVFRGDEALNIVKENIDKDNTKVMDVFNQVEECAKNAYDLVWKVKCQSSRKETDTREVYNYDQNCLYRMKVGLYVQGGMVKCIEKSTEMYAASGGAINNLQNCYDMEYYQREACKTGSREVTEVYDTCEGKRLFVMENGYHDKVLIVPSEDKPDFQDIKYKTVVRALLEKYGPARSSHQKITPNYEKWEIFYWVDGAWVMQVEVEVSEFKDDATVYRMNTYYVNFPACKKQSKYMEEEKRKQEIAAQKAAEAEQKAIEEKNKNFKL